jgi:hypothetical protein
VGKPERQKPRGSRKRKWKDNIKMHLEENRYEICNTTDMTVVKKVMKDKKIFL